MKHFLRIFSIFLAITFSLNASKSYGQTGVTISIDKSIICPGENIFINAISTERPYPYVLIYVSDDNVTFLCPTYKHTITDDIMSKYVTTDRIYRLRTIPIRKSEVSLYLNFKSVWEYIIKTYK